MLLYYKFTVELAGERISKSVNIWQSYRQECYLSRSTDFGSVWTNITQL